MKKCITLFMAVCIVAAGSCAFGAVELWCNYDSFASLKDGKANYDDARFSNAFLSVHSDSIVTKETARLTGSISFSGGRYSFWNGTEIQKVSDTPMTYKLRLETGISSGDTAAYGLFTETDSEFRAAIEADGGLKGVTMTWNFPDDPSMNGTFTFPNYKTTQEQLDSCVPYFEFIRSGDVVTGINWRVVKASDTSTAVSQDFRIRFNSFEVWNYDYEKILNDRPRLYIEAGDIPEGVYEFDSPIKEADICRVRVRLYTYDEEVTKHYSWDYFTQTSNMHLWKRHASDALLVNGKSDYSTAKFPNVFFEAENRNSITIEAKHFTDAGRITVPGGGYTLVDADTGETLRTVTGDTTLKLRLDSECTITDSGFEYWPTDDSGKFVAWAGGAETGLNGKTISWTFPEEWNLNGSGVIPNFKSTAEQLDSGVPYVELVSKDGYITAINYKIVTASDTTTVITPSYRTDFSFMIFHDTTRRNRGTNIYNAGTARNTASGTYTLDTPQSVDTMKQLRVRLLTYENGDNPDIYQWWFTPAEAPAPITITTSPLPSGTVNSHYTATLEANVSGATWEISSGSLPAGLTLNPSTGVISGTPTTADTSTFTVRASMTGRISGEKQFSITVNPFTPATITIKTSSLPSGTVGTSYSATLEAYTSPATWSLISGTLPAGLSLNSSTGIISGTPTTAGTSTFAVMAVSGSASAEKSLSITIIQPVIGVDNPGSGGCESFTGIAGLILLAFLIKKR